MRQATMVNQINDAIGAHGMWKLQLRTAISTGRSHISARDACRDDQCAFGKWLHGADIDATTKAGMPYQVVRRLHAEFHTCAGNVLNQMERGNAPGAIALLDGEYTQRTDKLVRALTKWKRELPQSTAIGRTAA